MSILASDLFTSVKSILDDDNSGRYSEVNDFTPLLNMAIDYTVIVFNAAFDKKKISPESLRELLNTAIISTTGSGTTKNAIVTSIMSNLWTIIGIDPDPVITTSPDRLSLTRNRWASRMTLEAWNDAALDPFSAGTVQDIPSDFIKPGYIGPGHFINDTDYHVFIRPAASFSADKVAVWYLKNPTKATSGSSSIEFPRSVSTFLIEKMLNYLSRQHGPESKYTTITDKEIMQLVNLVNNG